MAIVRWAAVALTLLMGLANLGQDTRDTNLGLKVIGLAIVLAAVYTPATDSPVAT